MKFFEAPDAGEWLATLAVAVRLKDERGIFDMRLLRQNMPSLGAECPALEELAELTEEQGESIVCEALKAATDFDGVCEIADGLELAKQWHERNGAAVKVIDRMLERLYLRVGAIMVRAHRLVAGGEKQIWIPDAALAEVENNQISSYDNKNPLGSRGRQSEETSTGGQTDEGDLIDPLRKLNKQLKARPDLAEEALRFVKRMIEGPAYLKRASELSGEQLAHRQQQEREKKARWRASRRWPLRPQGQKGKMPAGVTPRG